MRYTLGPVTPEHYPRMAAIITAQSREVTTAEELLREDRLRPKEYPHFRIGAFTPEGILMGYAGTGSGGSNRPGEFGIRVRVDEPYRGQGIGRALYEQVLAYARSKGATRLETMVREDFPDAIAWAERRGFATEHHLFQSTLSLTEWDPTPFQEVLARVTASGIRFTTLAAETRDGDRVAALRRYYAFSHRLAKDIPGQSDRPDTPWEHYLTWVTNDPHWKDELIVLAADGDRWVALCQMNPQESGSLYNGFTAVDREYRGRNLALAVKVKGLELARETGASFIRTNNHSVNAPMLAVNRKLGYVPEPGFFHMAARI